MKRALTAALAALLAGCTSTPPPPLATAPRSQPAATAILQPTASAQVFPTFEAIDGATGLRCAGTYQNGWSKFQQIPMTCSDGRVGTAFVTLSEDGRTGAGRMYLADGSVSEIQSNAPSPVLTSEPATATAPSVSAPVAAHSPPSYRPHCAENNSCYGDISAATGRPKTVHVGGYYRKDGTYVRGHYRSKPRR